MTLSKLVLLFLSGIVFIMVSCVKETLDLDTIAETDWDPEWCAHVVHSDMSIENLVKKDSYSMIRIDEKNFITLVYKNTIFSKNAAELINIPNQTYSTLLPFSVPASFPVNNTTQNTYFTEFDFSVPDNMIIDSVITQKIKVNLHFTSNVNSNVDITVSTANITYHGSPFNVIVRHKYLGFPTETIDTTFELDTCKITFNNTGVVKNKFPFSIKVFATSLGNAVKNPYSITAGFTIENIKFQKIFGYLGQLLTSMDTGNIRILMYENNVNGSYQFIDPKLNIIIKNSFGIPVRLNLNKLISHSDNNSPFNIPLSGVPNQWNLNAAAKIGKFDSSEVQLNKGNSNILNAFSISPTEFKYQFDAQTNPNGNVSQNFALSDSRIQVDGNVEIPLYCTASGYILEDTIAENMKDITGNSEMINYINLLVRINNTFPLESKIQIYLVDSNRAWPPVDSLFNGNEVIIGASAPGPLPDLKSSDPVIINKKIMVPASRVKNWDKVKFFIIRATLNTYKNGSVPIKIYSDNRLKVDVGVQTKFKVKIKP